MVLAPRRGVRHDSAVLITVWALSGGGHPWFAFSLFGWGIFLAVHGIYAFVMKTPEEIIIERAVRAQ